MSDPINTLIPPALLGRHCSAHALPTKTKPTKGRGTFPNLPQGWREKQSLTTVKTEPPSKTTLWTSLKTAESLWVRTSCQPKVDSHRAARTSHFLTAVMLKSQPSFSSSKQFARRYRKDVEQVSVRVFVMLAGCNCGNRTAWQSKDTQQKASQDLPIIY